MRARFALVAALVTACSARPADGPKVHVDVIKFSHDFHAKLDFGCETCHDGVEKATSLATSFLPKEAVCLQCHSETKDEGDCGYCHTDAKNPGTYARAELAARFPHDRHVAAKVECKSCHAALSEPGKPVRTPADHDTCTSCHQPHGKALADGACETCHDNLNQFAIAPVSLFSHAGDFLRTHGEQARTAADSCMKCHDQTTCADCHSQTVATRIEVKLSEDVQRSFIHRGDYITRHALEARADASTCGRCHGTSFCESCHQMQKLTTLVPDPRNPHPPGWSFPGAIEFHGKAAREDIVSCASCHDQGAASVCVTCHKVGGVGGNPHPSGFLSRHDEDEISDNATCRVCHN